VISRPLVIALAFIAASMRGAQGAWTEAIGLGALGTGLLILKLGETRPALRQYAYLCFLFTAASVVMVILRTYR
jgi:hypothetical protein